jgi:hypothetical protein
VNVAELSGPQGAPVAVLSVQVQPAAFLLIILGLAGMALVAQAVLAWLNGASLAAVSRSISSLRAGRVRLGGIVEPAWAVASSPFEQRACVWYDSRSTRGSGRSEHLLFREINAVSFVLNDGTGQILVLGRRGRWNGSAGRPGSAPFETSAGLAAELGRPLADPPEALYSDSPRRSDPAEGDRNEKLVAIGERVTVIGQALPWGIVSGFDACPDAGESLGLPGGLVIGPGRIFGLSITSGYPEDLANRGRLRLVLGLVGAVAVVVALVGLVLAANDIGPVRVLP